MRVQRVFIWYMCVLRVGREVIWLIVMKIKMSSHVKGEKTCSAALLWQGFEINLRSGLKTDDPVLRLFDAGDWRDIGLSIQTQNDMSSWRAGPWEKVLRLAGDVPLNQVTTQCSQLFGWSRNCHPAAEETLMIFTWDYLHCYSLHVRDSYI